MSRRKPRIEFTGLRFFLQKTEGKVSREELVEFIRRFFTSRGLKYGTVRVQFRMTRRPTSVIDGKVRPIAGRMHPHEYRVEIYLGAITFSMTPTEIMEVIAHELDHVIWEWEGREFDHSLPYYDRPYEIRARATGIKWQLRFAARI